MIISARRPAGFEIRSKGRRPAGFEIRSKGRRLAGFEIRSKGVCFSFCWGITYPPGLIGRTFFDGGLQIRRDAIIARKDLPKRPERAEFPRPGQSSWVR